MTEPWLTIVGIGDDGWEGLAPKSVEALRAADILIGGSRHLALVPADVSAGKECLTWTEGGGKQGMIDLVLKFRGQRTCVLASGDPLDRGMGATLLSSIRPEDFRVIPTAGSISLACARMGWDRARVETITLHGRPLERIAVHFRPGVKIIALSHDGTTPAAVARLLVAKGCADSRITVLEHLNGSKEDRIGGLAKDWELETCADLNVIAVEVVPGDQARVLSRLPGLPDNAFDHDGQLTKRDIRAAVLSRLELQPGQLLWDVGSGSGSIAIEMMRASTENQAVAFERKPERAERIRENALNLGAPGLEVVQGDAPDTFEDRRRPERIFLGGGVSEAGLIQACWEALLPGGILVANAVTLEGEQALLLAKSALGGELVRISVELCEELGSFTGWEPQRAVILWTVAKDQT
ncbi:MAG: precorrin-6y C5,15-methyltransferase (decarboxylating) subunit CbiE [Magnetovibrionaceae bacterium]